jgi:hypothetical protein
MSMRLKWRASAPSAHAQRKEPHAGVQAQPRTSERAALKVSLVSTTEVRITDGPADHQGHLLRSPRVISCSLKCVVGDFVAEDLFEDRIDCFVVHDTKPHDYLFARSSR